jgi:hypothetical protein
MDAESYDRKMAARLQQRRNFRALFMPPVCLLSLEAFQFRRDDLAFVRAAMLHPVNL